MKNYKLLKIFIVVASCGFCIVGCSKKAAPKPEVVTTSSYLAAAAKDILGEKQNILTLSGPGNCPGHFDIKPSQIETMSAAKIFLRFNFQSHFDKKLTRFTKSGMKIVAIAPAGGMCDPKTYQNICSQVAESLVKANLITQQESEKRLKEIDNKLAKLSADIKSEIASKKLSGSQVVSAKHQAKFCKAIGLDVVCTYSGADVPAELSAVVNNSKKQDVKFVIGNAPQGRAVPDRLANLMECKPVIFDNFPAPSSDGFYSLVRGNVKRLCTEPLK